MMFHSLPAAWRGPISSLPHYYWWWPLYCWFFWWNSIVCPKVPYPNYREQNQLNDLWGPLQNENSEPQPGSRKAMSPPHSLAQLPMDNGWLQGLTPLHLDLLGSWMQVGKRTLLGNLLHKQCGSQTGWAASALSHPAHLGQVPDLPSLAPSLCSCPRSTKAKWGAFPATRADLCPPHGGGEPIPERWQESGR